MEIFKKGLKEWERGAAPKRGRLEDGEGAEVALPSLLPTPPPYTHAKEKHVKNMRGGLPAPFSGSCGKFVFHM